MTQGELTFSVWPRPADLFKEGSQTYSLYCRLLDGPVTNDEIVRKMGIFNSTGRVSDIRAKIRPYLLDVVARPVLGSEGRWIYKLEG